MATRRGARATWISLAALLATALLQLLIVGATDSVALLADTIHNFTDALTAIPLLIAFRLARRPPTKRYSYGYHRAEDLAGVVIVAVILVSAVVAAIEAVQRLIHPQPVDHVGWLLAAGLIGAVGNESVALYRDPGGAVDRLGGHGGRRSARPDRRAHLPGGGRARRSPSSPGSRAPTR